MQISLVSIDEPSDMVNLHEYRVICVVVTLFFLVLYTFPFWC